MVKRLTAKVGEYEKDGQTKGRYVDLGVILSNQNGEFMLLDPSVNLAGVLMQQRILGQAKGQKASDRVMVSIFDNDRQQGGQSNGGYQGGGQQGGGSQGYGDHRDMDDEIPF
ncbi:MAG: hypothetical protein ABNH26_08640 [Celeribacter sp.]|jgi:hypothetical protein